jgi:sugar phosphate isomerase/epimerase
MLEFSCADYTFPLLSRVKTLQLLRLLEFNWVDIGLFERNSRFLPSDLMASSADFTRSVIADLQSTGVQVADVFLQVGLEPSESSANDPNIATRARTREVFLRAINFCHDVGCTHMTGLPGVHHGVAEQDYAIAVEEAAWRLDQCKQAGIVYSIEPHIGSIVGNISEVHNLLADVTELTLTLDYGHFVCLGEESTAIHNLLPHASHIHARAGARGKLQANLADNNIDFEVIISRLCANDYRGKIALEYVWVDWMECNRSDNISETILLRQRLRNFIDLYRKA